MPVEIERKFLVSGDAWRRSVSRSERFGQGYLATTPSSSIRVRLGEGRAWLGIKGRVVGMSRAEYEYEIPVAEASEILRDYCADGRLEKIRHWVGAGGREWEIDEFLGANAGLVVAELEIESEAAEFERPAWLGREVTDDVRYYNASLARQPYGGWTAREQGEGE
ncbi:MAG TPA: CYTH domain-containing protein [Steroidobacteraceae bacterium]